ncbi:probable phytanoyl-CoA dioxygenase [Diadema antillarum]|uniref:probable phytanoyl-CoA dioxygenase n=1 Tax=Diadema antillarum TaxID=105358 RepID=UPI003A8540D4
MSSATFDLSAEQIAEFRENGAICLRQAFGSEWLDVVRRGIEKNMAAPGENVEVLDSEHGSGKYFTDFANWWRIPEFDDFVRRSPAAEIVGKLMGSKHVVFYHELVVSKEPGTDRITPWHQDQPYFPINGDQVCSIWMPIDPVAKETCVTYIKGSHRWGKWFYPQRFKTYSDYEADNENSCDTHEWTSLSKMNLDKEIDQYELLSWELQPGDCIVFHLRTVHMAPANASRVTPRRVLSTRWAGDDVTGTRRPWKTTDVYTKDLTPGKHIACEKFPVVWKAEI